MGFGCLTPLCALENHPLPPTSPDTKTSWSALEDSGKASIDFHRCRIQPFCHLTSFLAGTPTPSSVHSCTLTPFDRRMGSLMTGFALPLEIMTPSLRCLRGVVSPFMLLSHLWAHSLPPEAGSGSVAPPCGPPGHYSPCLSFTSEWPSSPSKVLQ